MCIFVLYSRMIKVVVQYLYFILFIEINKVEKGCFGAFRVKKSDEYFAL